MTTNPRIYTKDIVDSLKELGWTISAAESCTSGMFLSSLADVPGASEVLDMGFVTYSTKSKTKLVGVDSSTINTYGVVSEEVAKAMAKGAAETANANVGIGITGYAGPGGGTDRAPVGTVCLGFYINGRVFSKTIQPDASKGRVFVRARAVEEATNVLGIELKRIINKDPIPFSLEGILDYAVNTAQAFSEVEFTHENGKKFLVLDAYNGLFREEGNSHFTILSELQRQYEDEEVFYLSQDTQNKAPTI